MSAVIKNFNLDAEGVTVAPPSPPPLPPAKKPKQGIGSILGSDSDHRAKTASIRRTLSADMSSMKWLSQNGMKKVASSGEFADDHHSFSGQEDDLSRPGQDEIWRAIQAQNLPQNDHHVKPTLRSSESWTSILTSQKTEDLSKLPPPYIHPLVKRTGSSLSEKSLEICTESLGSETGSDGFSLHSPAAESGDLEEKEVILIHDQQKTEENENEIHFSHSFDVQAVKFSYSKKSPPRAFPPPLPSLAKNKSSVQVLSRRQNGRLILEAISVPPQDYLHAERHDGRLLLTLVNGEETDAFGSSEKISDSAADISENIGDSVADISEEIGDSVTESSEEIGDSVIDSSEEIGDSVTDSSEETGDSVASDEEEGLGEWEKGNQNSVFPNMPPPFMKNFKKNTLWSKEEDLIITPAGMAGLIPAAAPLAAAAIVNTYDYFWRKKPTVASVIETEQSKDTTNHLKNNNVVETPKFAAYEQKDSVVILRGNKANNMIPFLRGCKESRRSLLPWEPFCIATT